MITILWKLSKQAPLVSIEHCQGDFQAMKTSWNAISGIAVVQADYIFSVVSKFCLGQVVGNKKRGVSRGIVLVQFSVGCDVFSGPIDSLFKSAEQFHVKNGVDGLSRSNKFMVDDTFDVKKYNEHNFHFGFSHFRHFWTGRRRRMQSDDCLFDSGSY